MALGGHNFMALGGHDISCPYENYWHPTLVLPLSHLSELFPVKPGYTLKYGLPRPTPPYIKQSYKTIIIVSKQLKLWDVFHLT